MIEPSRLRIAPRAPAGAAGYFAPINHADVLAVADELNEESLQDATVETIATKLKSTNVDEVERLLGELVTRGALRKIAGSSEGHEPPPFTYTRQPGADA